MKKEYKTPSIRVITTESTTIMCGSGWYHRHGRHEEHGGHHRREDHNDYPNYNPNQENPGEYGPHSFWN